MIPINLNFHLQWKEANAVLLLMRYFVKGDTLLRIYWTGLQTKTSKRQKHREKYTNSANSMGLYSLWLCARNMQEYWVCHK